MVMYLGRVAEKGPTEDLFNRPLHPYTRALLASAPKIDPAHRVKSEPLSGELPSPINPPSGCAFHKRCPFATARCSQDRPELRMIDSREVACHRVEEIV
jgi:dipeptide transport system ATP-binding protein